jgi:PAS domain S-box-containing protein
VKYSILIVEDELPLLTLLEKIIAKKIPSYSFEIDAISSYNEALKAIHSKRYDLILADYKLREGCGLDLLRDMKQKNTKGYTAFIVATSYNSIDLLENLFDEGVDAFLSKPFSVEHVVNTVLRLIKKVEQKKKMIENEYLLQQYQQIVDSGSIVSKTDTKGIITYVNEKFCQISGYKAEELIGKNHNIVRHPDTPKEVFQSLWETIKKKQIYKGIIKNKKRNGQEYYVDATIMPVLDSKGNIVEYVGMRHDITERERHKRFIETSLSQSKQSICDKENLIKQYEDAISHTTAVSRTDINGVIHYVNDEFCTLCGYSKSELLGQTHALLRSEKTPQSTYKNLWKSIQNKQVFKTLFENRTKDGAPFWVNSTIVPIYDSNGETVEFMNLVHDVTQVRNLSDEIIKTQQDVIFQLGAIGESRSKETANHVKRVTLYSKNLALLAGLSKNDVDLIEQASPMHDIGKIGIPDAILNKPGKLTQDEYEQMKAHTQLGHSMLANSNREILKAAAIIAHQHHERWDGNGYPQGLQKEQIHIFGRITAVADVFDALSSRRCYKKAWEIDAVLRYLEENAGKQFDPHLIRLFLDNFVSFKEIFHTYQDVF